MPKIFISYRRKDSAPFVGRIYERLAREFGESNIFYDIEDIPKGKNFKDVLRHNVASCDILLAMIGPHWSSITDADGNKRLFNENDYVRYEVDTALRLPKVSVIPVLINEAEMPSRADLPPVLHDLTELNAIKVRNDPDFRRDMDDLVKVIGARRSWTPIGIALVAVLIVAIIGLLVFAPRLFQSVAAASTATQSPTTVVSSPTEQPTSTFTPTHEPSPTPLPPSETPSPTDTPMAIPPSLLPPEATPANGQLHLYSTRDSLTLFVTQQVSLMGFQFGIVVDSKLKHITLADSFSSLQFTTTNTANANDCYIYQADGAAPPLSQSCKVQVFRTNVAAADVFWYDTVANKPRDLAIFRDGQSTDIICSASIPDCLVNWAAFAFPPSIPIVAASTTSETKAYPCQANIIFTTGAMLNQVRVTPQKNAPTKQPVQQGAIVSVLSKQRNDGLDWYQITYGGNTGWIPSEYVIPSDACPTN